MLARTARTSLSTAATPIGILPTAIFPPVSTNTQPSVGPAVISISASCGCSIRQHLAGRHHLLLELAELRRRGLHGRLGIRQVRLGFLDLRIDRRRIDRRRRTRAGTLGRRDLRIALAVERLQPGAGIFALADRRRHLRVARVLLQPRRRLGDLLAGDAALPELGGGEHLGQQRLALRGVVGRRRGIGVEARRDHHGAGAGLQRGERADGAAAQAATTDRGVPSVPARRHAAASYRPAAWIPAAPG